MSKDFDISVEDILDGKLTKKRKRNLCYSTTVDTTNVSQVKELLAMK